MATLEVMLSPGELSRAPIVEAILSVQFGAPAPDIAEAMAWLEAQSEYSEREELIEKRLDFSTDLDAVSPLESHTSQQNVGFLATSPTGNRQIELRPGALALHQFAPYGSWTQFQAEAKRIFEGFRAISSAPIVGASLRYLNRLELPLIDGGLKFDDWLQTRPEVGETFPGKGMSSYFLRLELPQDDVGAMLVLQQGVIPASSESVGVLLDCELFSLTPVADDAALWERYELWRDRKNSAFWECLTDRTRELLR